MTDKDYNAGVPRYEFVRLESDSPYLANCRANLVEPCSLGQHGFLVLSLANSSRPIPSTSKNRKPFVGDRRAGDIAAQVLQFLALIGAPAHRRMEAKAVEFGA